MSKGKVVSLEDRVPKLKQQRKRKANIRLIILLLLFFLLICCVVYFQSPISHVNQIRIIGNEAYADEELITLSGLTSETNIWNLEKSPIEKRIEELVEVREANVKVVFPNHVEIKVEEWNKIAFMMKDGLFLPILENGEILEDKRAGYPVSSPILIGFKEGEIMDEMLASLREVPKEVANSISEIHYTPKKTDDYHITLYMNDGFEVSASLRSFVDNMVHYPSIVSQLDPNIKGTIDLEVGSFFRAYETEGAEEENEVQAEG